MKATLSRQHGGPEALEYSDFPDPELKPGEALVKLRAAHGIYYTENPKEPGQSRQR